MKDLRDQIINTMAPDISFDGWSVATAHKACDKLKIPHERVATLFPNGVCDMVAHFSDMMDRKMFDALEKIDADKLRTRDRIETAVWTRLSGMEEYKDMVRLALAYWSVPPRTVRGAQVIWRTADRVWDFAGDTASDYNRYTKRGLLAGILTATTLVWLKDTSENHATTRLFLSNRIENVLKIGQTLGKLKRNRA